MIIARYLIKEITLTLLAVFMVLMLIGLSGQLVGVFSRVADGTLGVNTVFIIFGLESLKMVLVLFPLSLYLAILMTLSRLHQNNEMAAISASGISQVYILQTVLSFAFLISVVVGIFSLQIIPWANGVKQEIDLVSENSSGMEGISAGRFRETSSGLGVIYVEDLNDEHDQMQGVFLQQQNKNNGEFVIKAQKGSREINKNTGDQFMLFENGVRYQKKFGKLDYTVIEFKQHGVRISEKSNIKKQKKHTALGTLDLIKKDGVIYVTEFHSRLAPIFLCILFSVLAVPLSQTSPRQGRYLRLGLGLLIYIVFTNFINIGKSWIIDAKVPTELGLWWVYAIMVCLAVVLIMQQVGFRYLFSKINNK